MADSRPQDFEPPMACVSRVMKAALPENILLTKDARAAFVRAAGIFIFYLTHCSNDFCRESKRATIFPQDVMAALRELGFEDFEKPLEEFLEAYKKDSEQRKPVPRTKTVGAAAEKYLARPSLRRFNYSSFSFHDILHQNHGEEDHNMDVEEDEGGADEEEGDNEDEIQEE